jgi:hypothetical protein
MIIYVNGPGIPVLDFGSGKRLKPPLYTEANKKDFADAEAVVVVEPFCTLTPAPFYDEFWDWIPRPGKPVLVMVRNMDKYENGLAWTELRQIPVLGSVIDVSILKRQLRDTVTERLVWVNRGQEANAELLRKSNPYIITFGDGCDIPGPGTGVPIYWMYDDVSNTLTGGPAYPETETKTISLSDKAKAEACIYDGDLGSFRIADSVTRVPDPGLVLRDTVLRETADPVFAELVETGFRELSVTAIKARA